MRTTLQSDAEQAGRAIEIPKRGETMARRGFQQGSLFQRGTRRKLWVARWWEDVIQSDGTLGRLRRSEVIGTVAEFPTRRLAMQEVLSQRARVHQQRQGKTRSPSVPLAISSRTIMDACSFAHTQIRNPTESTIGTSSTSISVRLSASDSVGNVREKSCKAASAEKLSNGLSNTGNRSPLQVWYEQDSRSSRGMGEYCRERL